MSQRRQFALSIDGKKFGLATVSFLSAIIHREVIIFSFFSHVCRITVCWDPAVVMDPPEILLPWQSETTSHLCISIEVSYGSLFSREELSVKTRIAWSVAVTKQDGHVFYQLRTKIIVLQCLTERKKRSEISHFKHPCVLALTGMATGTFRKKTQQQSLSLLFRLKFNVYTNVYNREERGER